MQRPLLAMSGVGLVVGFALWGGLLSNEGIDVTGGNAKAKPGRQSAGASASSLDSRLPTTHTMATTAPPASLSGLPSATTPLATPITVTAPQQMLVGDMNDLVFGVGANEGVKEISFTVQFDANVLQVRAGMEGDWAMDPRLDTRFAAEISGKEDRVQVRSSVSGQGAGIAGGSVAIVRFQAVAPGKTAVLITDVVVKDLTGRSIAFAVSGSDLQMTVDSIPPEGFRR